MAPPPLLLAAALRLGGQYIQDFHGEYGAAEKLRLLANEMEEGKDHVRKDR